MSSIEFRREDFSQYYDEYFRKLSLGPDGNSLADLTLEQQIKLSRDISQGKYARSILDKSNGELSQDERTNLEKTIAKGRAAEETLAYSNQRLSVKAVKVFSNGKLPFEDAHAAANEGLAKAIFSYDGNLGNHFSTHAMWQMRAAIQRSALELAFDFSISSNRMEELGPIFRLAIEEQEKTGIPYTQERIQELILEVYGTEIIDEETGQVIKIENEMTIGLKHAHRATLPLKSVNDPIGDDDDGTERGDFLHDPENQFERVDHEIDQYYRFHVIEELFSEAELGTEELIIMLIYFGIAPSSFSQTFQNRLARQICEPNFFLSQQLQNAYEHFVLSNESHAWRQNGHQLPDHFKSLPSERRQEFLQMLQMKTLLFLGSCDRYQEGMNYKEIGEEVLFWSRPKVGAIGNDAQKKLKIAAQRVFPNEESLIELLADL